MPILLHQRTIAQFAQYLIGIGSRDGVLEFQRVMPDRFALMFSQAWSPATRARIEQRDPDVR